MIKKQHFSFFMSLMDKKQLLFIKTHERNFYIFPGGVQQTDENFESVLHREIKDNLNIEIENIRELGVSSGHAPSGVPLEMHLFTARPSQEPIATGEIKKYWPRVTIAWG